MRNIKYIVYYETWSRCYTTEIKTTLDIFNSYQEAADFCMKYNGPERWVYIREGFESRGRTI